MKSTKQNKRRLSKAQLSVEFNSAMCAKVLGKSYRNVHEIMEGIKKPQRAKSLRD